MHHLPHGSGSAEWLRIGARASPAGEFLDNEQFTTSIVTRIMSSRELGNQHKDLGW